MSSQPAPRPKLKIKADHIGPIMKLDGQLSDQKQNLIFARNGIGKSFFARSLRMLDEDALDGIIKEEIPGLLVSEEATNGRGNFHLYEDNDCIGGLDLNVTSKNVVFSSTKYIFHVFSEDYVDLHLRQKRFNLDGNITHEIIVGQENLLLDEKTNAALAKRTTQITKQADLDQKFEATRGQLRKDFQINASLGSYKNLTTSVYFESQAVTDTKPQKSQAEFLKDYNKFKSLPSDAQTPKIVGVAEEPVNVNEVRQIMARVTSPSTVANEVKKRILRSPEFFKKGIEFSASSTDCPFCTQELKDVAINAIEAYQAYFADEEAKQQQIIAKVRTDIQGAVQGLSQIRTQHLTAKSQYDDLKAFFPSIHSQQVEDIEPNLNACEEAFAAFDEALSNKAQLLAMPALLPTVNLTDAWANLVDICERNGRLFAELETLLANSSSERKSIQGKACIAMRYEFYQAEVSNIDEIRLLETEITGLRAEITELKKTQGDKADARTRVVETFELLLCRFFGQKYTFDATSFKVLREQKDMARGSDRTLSDGEKSVMAFCYFVAQAHLKVAANDDYQRLYFVFDDPVTSMSFDYVYEIVQTLKLWRVGSDGSFDFNPKSSKPRPRMLILTHNNYFYNVASSNNAVPKPGLFQLVSSSTEHKLSAQKGFATPHQQQLKHVYDVSEGNILPDFMTPNCIRSVVEGMWKFCRPDCKDFGVFFEFLIDECGIEIKSVLINDLSHGGKFDDPPHKEQDIVDAAKEAIDVVTRFAPGQIKTAAA